MKVGMIFATVGAVLATFLILVILCYWAEVLIDIWVNRWEWVRKLLVRKIIFRTKMDGEYSPIVLNRDIDTLNRIFDKYELDYPYDREERQYVRELKKEFEG